MTDVSEPPVKRQRGPESIPSANVGDVAEDTILPDDPENVPFYSSEYKTPDSALSSVRVQKGALQLTGHHGMRTYASSSNTDRRGLKGQEVSLEDFLFHPGNMAKAKARFRFKNTKKGKKNDAAAAAAAAAAVAVAAAAAASAAAAAAAEADDDDMFEQVPPEFRSAKQQDQQFDSSNPNSEDDNQDDLSDADVNEEESKASADNAIVIREVIPLNYRDGYVTEDCNVLFVLKKHPDAIKSYTVSIKVKSVSTKECVACLRGYLMERPTRAFYSTAVEIDPELHELAWTFCESNGRADRVNHPQLRNPEVHSGGFFHILQVEVRPTHQHRDLGLWVVHQALASLRDRWTLAVMEPAVLCAQALRFPTNSSLEDLDDSTFERAHVASASLALKCHFSRMGFTQAGKTPDLSNAFFLTSEMYFPRGIESMAAVSRWKSKSEANAADIYLPPIQHVPRGLDDELSQTVCKYYLTSAQRFKLMQGLIARGADIHRSRAMFVAAANESSMGIDSLKELVLLGGDINARDENGNTPLHIAASFNSVSAVEYLLREGAIRAVYNLDGETPKDAWDMAAEEPSELDYIEGMGITRLSNEDRIRISSLLACKSGRNDGYDY